jgi:hypothetical protein
VAEGASLKASMWVTASWFELILLKKKCSLESILLFVNVNLYICVVIKKKPN